MSNKDHGRCLVCDDIATGFNFGVPTCSPCKAFFRRNAPKLHIQTFICANDGDCLITHEYRRNCNCCRLAKCFRVGMKKELILTDEQREARNQLVKLNRLKRGQICKLQSINCMKSPSLICISENCAEYLSSSDQVVLNNIFHAYENTCIVAKNTQFQTFPAIQHTSIHEFLNEGSFLLAIIIEYFKQIKEFVNINMDDKIRLVKDHFGILININETFMYRPVSTNLLISWTNVFGSDITQRILKRNKLLEEFIYDPILLKIVLIILILSNDSGRDLVAVDIDAICDDSLSIFAAQNVYVELLWRYILSRSSSLNDAAKFLNRLIMCILFTKNLDMQMYSYLNSFKDEIEQVESLLQNMWPKEDDMNMDV